MRAADAGRVQPAAAADATQYERTLKQGIRSYVQLSRDLAGFIVASEHLTAKSYGDPSRFTLLYDGDKRAHMVMHDPDFPIAHRPLVVRRYKAACAVSKKSRHTVAEINHAIRTLQKDRRLAAIYDRYR